MTVRTFLDAQAALYQVDFPKESIDQKPALKMIAGDATDSYGCSEEPQGPNGRQV